MMEIYNNDNDRITIKEISDKLNSHNGADSIISCLQKLLIRVWTGPVTGGLLEK